MVDTRDRWHQACVGAAGRLRLPLVATTPVLTETFYFAAKRGIVWPTWTFIRNGGIRLAMITDADLPALETLMHRYADRPMDFADATLVHVADREGLRTILTIDHSDFETYRIGRSAKFPILPAR
jgi:predicted nucleic acid-binding protein